MIRRDLGPDRILQPPEAIFREAALIPPQAEFKTCGARPSPPARTAGNEHRPMLKPGSATSHARPSAVTAPTDEDLMIRVKRGEVLAFRLLSTRHVGRAHAIALRITHNREDAEEAVQDALTKVWQHATRYDDGRSAFSTWFYSILSRSALDRLRRRPRPAEDIDDHAEALADASESGEAAWLRHGEAKRVRHAVAALPPQQKLAVVLCYYQDFTQPEAAHIMDMNLKALEGLLFRARKTLKASLAT